MFFEGKDVNNLIKSFLNKVEHVEVEDAIVNQRLTAVKRVLKIIQKNPSVWDEKCKVNIKHIGSSFVESLSNFDHRKHSHIEGIYCITYYFLCEFEFFLGEDMQLGFDLEEIKRQVFSDIDNLEGSAKSRIIYASYLMPANLAKDYINSSHISAFRDADRKTSEARDLIDEWNSEIDEKRNVVQNLKDSLEQYKAGFNFVGLHQGFGKLYDEKNKECKMLFWSLIAMGALLLLPLMTTFYMSFNIISKNGSISLDYLYLLVPVLSIEFILIYFFRILLFNHKSAKTQKMQIELRQALCQFIQSYADYSVQIKQKDDKALEKFENLIFSSILSDSENMPSTFDGLEQIGSILKKVKGS